MPFEGIEPAGINAINASAGIEAIVALLNRNKQASITFFGRIGHFLPAKTGPPK